ncbi:MAG: MarR family transcriptional regulator [Methanomicrobiaceae archaeon]|nr:MarR family transcriptional regulator [Methanomicrobiaceae archaeon]
MREEEIDWDIYHIIAYENSASIEEISSKSGFESETITESLKRLESNCLIRYDGEKAGILSVPEMLLKCRIKHAVCEPDSPVIIENGVIKANPDYEG